MLRQLPSLRLALTFALRHPRTAFRLAFEDRWRLATLACNALPGRIRRSLAGFLAGIATAAGGRSGTHARAVRLLAFARSIRGDRDGALRMLGTLGRTASPHLSDQLARAALSLGDPGLADSLIARHPELPSDEDRELRGRVAFAVGRYRDALRLFDSESPKRTAGGGSRTARRVRAELALLDPAWRPAGLSRGTPGATAKPGTILHLLTNSLPYRQAGYTLRAQWVARCQHGVGLDPQMATRAGFPANEGRIASTRSDVVDGVRYHRIRPAFAPDQLPDRIAEETALGLSRLVRSLGAAALQPTSNYANAQAALAVGAAHGIPVVYEVRGFLEETWLSGMAESTAGAEVLPAALESDRYLLTRAIETDCMRRADAVVTLSETMRAEMIERGIDPGHVTVVPNAVDVDAFTPGPRDEALAAQLGIEPDETVIGYISSLTPYEGVTYLIDAVALLVEAGRRVRLLVVGDGVVLPALRAQAQARGLLANRLAIFTGRVPFATIERYYRLIDVFVVPRTNDRVSQLVTPLKPYEAMAMERAMVVSDVPALTEIVRDGETGRVFPAQDPAALAGVLEGLIANPAERARLGTAARAWVAEHRTWASNGRRYLELYRRLGAA